MLKSAIDLERKNLDLLKRTTAKKLNLIRLKLIQVSRIQALCTRASDCQIEDVNADLQKQNVELVAGQNAMAAELDQLKEDPIIQSN